MEKKKLIRLKSKEYEHHFDRQAMEALKQTPGLETVTRKVLGWGLEKVYRIEKTGSAIKVNSNNLPHIHNLYMETCDVLDMHVVPALFIKQGFDINAYAFGCEKPIVCLNQGVVNRLKDEEIVFIMGHELGHIKSNHVLYKMMAEFLIQAGHLLGLLTSFIIPVQAALSYWSRMSEFTADRVGMLAVQNVQVAIDSAMKMSGYPDFFYKNMNSDDFLDQASEFKELDFESLNKVMKIYLSMDMTHPWTVLRASEINDWVEKGQYKKIIDRFSEDNNKDMQYGEKSKYCASCGITRKSDLPFCVNCGQRVY